MMVIPIPLLFFAGFATVFSIFIGIVAAFVLIWLFKLAASAIVGG